jgi:hypothetical protein
VEFGINYVARTTGDRLGVFDGAGYSTSFFLAVNMGIALPGFYPSGLAPIQSDFARWFAELTDLGVNAVRMYGLQNPEFYAALWEYNAEADTPLRLIQGVVTPDELIGTGEGFREGIDVWNDDSMEIFYSDIVNTVKAVHGGGSITKSPDRPTAFGNYTYDISPYIIAYIIGSEPTSTTVQVTNKAHPDVSEVYQEGKYFR